MSILFHESDSRLFKSNSSNSNQSHDEHRLFTQSSSLQTKTTNNQKVTTCFSQVSNTRPKVPSNLVRSSTSCSNSFGAEQEANSREQSLSLHMLTRDQLVDSLNEKQNVLFAARNEYVQYYENFYAITRKFHLEKLGNLKLSFRNQILKQQIYFETELFELSKEFMNDFKTKNYNTKLVNNKNNNQNSPNPFEREKQCIKLFKLDVKKLLDYMRDSLLNSIDTLIEAYETCQVLKSLESIENKVQKQNANLNHTFNILIEQANGSTRNDKQNNTIKNRQNGDVNNLNDEKDEEDGAEDELSRTLKAEQEMIDKYKREMEELMHTLDDIEVQHLHRKELHVKKDKFLGKLKSKFKFIENKYDLLNKQVTHLKYESDVYKQLWLEKQRSSMKELKEEKHSYENSCKSSSLSPSSSSRSSSTSSLSDCFIDLSLNEHHISSSGVASASNITSACASATAENTSSTTTTTTTAAATTTSGQLHTKNELEELLNGMETVDSLDEDSSSSSHITHSSETQSNKKYPALFQSHASYLSLNDYNRKLNIINSLINLHKTKLSGNQHDDSFGFNTESARETKECNTINVTIASAHINSSVGRELNENSSCAFEPNLLHLKRKSTQNSSLDLSECSTDGDKIIIENCNLKLDKDISNWYVTRQIENMSSVNSFQIPNGSVIKSGKVMRIRTPFQNDQLEFLLAIKQLYHHQSNQQQSDINELDNNHFGMNRSKRNSCLRIITKLINPDGVVKATHTQEIPKFYHEIFKYANLIQFI
jgi:hypothetical protein